MNQSHFWCISVWERASVTYWFLSMAGYLLTYLTLPRVDTLSTLGKLEMIYLITLILGTIPMHFDLSSRFFIT